MEEPKWYGDFTNVFAIIIGIAAFTYLYLITFFQVDESNLRMVDTILGFLLGSVIQPIIVWAFRSSKAQIDKEKAEVASSVIKSTQTITTNSEPDTEIKK